MIPYKSYANPLITEAVIDFQVEHLPEISLSNLENLQNILKDDYPLFKHQSEIKTEIINSPEDIKAQTSQKIIGFILINNLNNQFLQTGLDRFTFSRLAPYEGWELFREEARRLWNIYQSETHPIKINQIGVRYINRLDIPFDDQGLINIENYLKTFPEISPNLPQELKNYFIKLDIAQEDINGLLIIQQTLVDLPGDNKIGIVLDIGLSCETNFSNDIDSQWQFLEKLRIRKNEIFEACITDQTRSLLNNA
jgi:uncharacterized protein (TIGR04255 family)